MNKIKKDITFISKQIENDSFVDVEITKTATFKDLCKTDKEQHRLHFMIMSVLQNFTQGANGNLIIDSDGVYDLTIKAINTLLIINDDFTEQDKAELLNDSDALLSFGTWLLGEKITPFFSTFKMK